VLMGKLVRDLECCGSSSALLALLAAPAHSQQSARDSAPSGSARASRQPRPVLCCGIYNAPTQCLALSHPRLSLLTLRAHTAPPPPFLSSTHVHTQWDHINLSQPIDHNNFIQTLNRCVAGWRLGLH
jgi:hypothetical protein